MKVTHILQQFFQLKRKAEEQRLREEEARREAEKQRKLKEQEEELRRLQEEREKSIMEEQIKQLDEQRNAILREQERTRELERQQEEQRRLLMLEQERLRQEEEQRRKQAAAAAASAGVAAAAGGIATVGGVPSVPPPSYDMVNAIKNQGVRPQNSAIYAPTPFANATTVPDSRLSPTAPPNRFVKGSFCEELSSLFCALSIMLALQLAPTFFKLRQLFS